MFNRLCGALALLAGALLVSGAASAELQKAHDDLAVTKPGQSVLIDVLGNDSSLGTGLRILKAFKPAHGSAAVENGRIRYTPAAGFQGSDSFRYMAQADKSQPGQATVSVEVGGGGVALRIAGRVVDDPIPGAHVTVSIGGFDFATVADANGNYVLDISALHGDAFVTLSAVGTSPTGAAVKFYSLVGEIVRLASAAGSDGVLVRDEFNQVNVTNLSTAQYTLLTDANGGVPITSDQQLLPLVQNIDLSRMLELAAIIKLVVDDGVPLPAGTTNVLDLISNPTAVQAFEVSLPAGELDVAIDAVSQDANVAPVFRAGALPTGYALLPPGAPGTIQPFTGVGALLTFAGSAAATSGGGSLVDSNIASAPATTWLLDAGGDLVITPVTPYVDSTQVVDVTLGPTCLAYTDEGFTIQDTDANTRLHRLQDGAGVDYLEVFTTVHRHYLDPNLSDGCVPPADSDITVDGLRLAFEDGSGELPFAANESFGQIALEQWIPSQNRLGAAIYNFDTHTVSIPGVQANFTSSIVNGRLLVTLTDSTTSVQTTYEYRRYQSDGHKGEGLFVSTTLPAPDGRQLASYNLASRVDGSLAFDFATMPGRWISGYDLSQFEGDGIQHFNGFSLIFRDGTPRIGNQRFFDANGIPDNGIGIGWNIESGSMIARGYVDNSLGGGLRGVGVCVSLDPQVCWQRRQRTWIPIARDGNRVYVVESVAFSSGPGQPLVLGGDSAQRVNFWELQPLGPNDFHVGALPGSYALVPPPAPGTIQPFSGAGVLLTFADSASAISGSGTAIDSNINSDPAINWALVAGDLQVTSSVPYVQNYDVDVTLGPSCPDFTDAGFHVQDTDRGSLIHRTQDTAGVDHLQIWSTVLRIYTDPDPADGCLPPNNGLVTTSTQRLAFEDGSGEMPFAPNESFGQFALEQWVPSENRWGAAIYDFNAHTVSIPGTQSAFSSLVSNGRLQVTLTDSTTSLPTTYEYRRLQSDGRNGEGLFLTTTLPDGRQLASYNLASRVDGSLVFDSNNLPGVWSSGFLASQSPGDGLQYGQGHFFVAFNSDIARTGSQYLLDALGNLNGTVLPFSWNIVTSAMVERSYFDSSLPGGQRRVSTCVSQDPLVCWLIRQRTWVPIASNGNRIYVVETVVGATGPNQPLVIGDGAMRVNFYDRQP